MHLQTVVPGASPVPLTCGPHLRFAQRSRSVRALQVGLRMVTSPSFARLRNKNVISVDDIIPPVQVVVCLPTEMLLSFNWLVFPSTSDKQCKTCSPSTPVYVDSTSLESHLFHAEMSQIGQLCIKRAVRPTLFTQCGCEHPQAPLKLLSYSQVFFSGSILLLLLYESSVPHRGLTSLSEDKRYLQDIEVLGQFGPDGRFGCLSGSFNTSMLVCVCVQPPVHCVCVCDVCKTCSCFVLIKFGARWTKFRQVGFKVVQIFSHRHRLIH